MKEDIPVEDDATPIDDDDIIIFDASVDKRIGNSFWRMRSKHGRYVKFTPQTLLSAAYDYFEWTEQNPLQVTELVKYKGGSAKATIPKMRALTLGGLLIFIDTFPDCWYRYAKDEAKEGYKEVCESIMNIMYTQKLTGAAADLLNANIISRELGLADSQKVASFDADKEGIQWIDEDK